MYRFFSTPFSRVIMFLPWAFLFAVLSGTFSVPPASAQTDATAAPGSVHRSALGSAPGSPASPGSPLSPASPVPTPSPGVPAYPGMTDQGPSLWSGADPETGDSVARVRPYRPVVPQPDYGYQQYPYGYLGGGGGWYPPRPPLPPPGPQYPPFVYRPYQNFHGPNQGGFPPPSWPGKPPLPRPR
jgi:hypothetical protein